MTDWKEIVINNDSTVWDREKALEGVYKRWNTNVGPNESNQYIITTSEGDVAVWGSTVIDTKMAEIQIGSKVKIEPQGKIKSEKTGREYLDFKIFWIPPEYQESGYEKAKSAAKKLDKVVDVPDEPLEMPEDWMKKDD